MPLSTDPANETDGKTQVQNFSNFVAVAPNDPCELRVEVPSELAAEPSASSGGCGKELESGSFCSFEPQEHRCDETSWSTDDNFSEEASFPKQSQRENDNFSFSSHQLSCPVIIEVFCGTARVTACLKELGLSEAFGVDHETGKAVATVKQLDLTLQRDQEIFLQWLRSPLLVGLFIAPSCGTCSLARNIKLRDKNGRPLRGPVPLRSESFPEGLPGLKGTNLLRVSLANRLYDFVGQVVEEAIKLGLLVVVENPRSSLFWRTRFWKRVAKHFSYVAHQACAYGGSRPKWTVLASNHKCFHSISLGCPGESAWHSHKPWGLVRTEEGFHFSASEETAYPRGLARSIARVFADILMQHGWIPPLEQFQVCSEANLRTMRAVATVQPKASKVPPVVREHKKILVMTAPVSAVHLIPVETMQRLKSAFFFASVIHMQKP